MLKLKDTAPIPRTLHDIDNNDKFWDEWQEEEEKEVTKSGS